jgi:hypothetical protein
MAVADALVLMGFILIFGLLAWAFTASVRKNNHEAVVRAERRATRAEAALAEVEAYVKDHYVEPEVVAIGDIIDRHRGKTV